MLLLASTSDLVRVVTDANGDIEVHASWVDNDAGTITPGRTNTASITGTTTTTVVASPTGTIVRNVKHLNIRNNHATQAVLTTVFHTDGTSQEDLFECTLLAGELMTFDQTGCWKHFDANGGEYPMGVIASQADMETATSLTTVVTPGRLGYHPSAAKFWCKSTPGNTVAASYNVTSVDDTGAGIATITIATDFSGGSWTCLCSCERAATGLTVTDLKYVAIRNATIAAGSVGIEVWDGTAVTAVQEDPSSWHALGFGDQ